MNTCLVLAFTVFLMMTSVQAGKKTSSSVSGHKNKSRQLAKKRILSELRELSGLGLLFDRPFNTSADECGIRLGPMKDNFFCWHFSITGVEGSHFEGGLYHGRILLHPEYPRKAPTICILTPNGRWEVGKEICLSASAHHPETWDPKWNLRTLVLSLRSFMLTHPREIGGIHTRPEVQRKLAAASRSYVCSICGINHAAITQESSREEHGHVLPLRVLTGKDRGNSAKKKPPMAPRKTGTEGRGKDDLALIDRKMKMATMTTEVLQAEDAREVIIARRPKLLSIIRVILTVAMLTLSLLGKTTISFNISL